jgi:hypothetical protein
MSRPITLDLDAVPLDAEHIEPLIMDMRETPEQAALHILKMDSGRECRVGWRR